MAQTVVLRRLRIEGPPGELCRPAAKTKDADHHLLKSTARPEKTSADQSDSRNGRSITQNDADAESITDRQKSRDDGEKVDKY